MSICSFDIMIFIGFVLSFIFLCSLADDNSSICKDLSKHKNYKLLPKPPNCGPIYPEDLAKIMGGQDAEVDEFPWMVTIYKEQKYNWGSRVRFCDGGLLTQRYVLTAAHCLYPYVSMEKYYLYVRFGEYDVTDYSEHKPKESPVSSLIVHEKYNDTTHDNDIGLMLLVRDIQFDSKTIFPICLPLTCDVINMSHSTSQLVLAGWGFVQERPFPVDSSVLQKIPMKYVSNDDCQEAWGDQLKINESQLCVRGSEGAAKSACRGDSGGPLMLVVNDTTYAVGVVSMGDACIPYDPSHNPNVFANVAAYMEWILDHMLPGNVKNPSDDVRNVAEVPPGGSKRESTNNVDNVAKVPSGGSNRESEKDASKVVLKPPGSSVWKPVNGAGNIVQESPGSSVWKPVNGAGNVVLEPPGSSVWKPVNGAGNVVLEPPGSSVWKPIIGASNVVQTPPGNNVWKPVNGAGNVAQGQYWGGARGHNNVARNPVQGPPVRWPNNRVRFPVQGPPRNTVRWPNNGARYPVQGPPRRGYGDYRRGGHGAQRRRPHRRYLYFVRPARRF